MKPKRDIPLWVAAGLLLLIASLLFGGIALAGTVGQADAGGALHNGAYVLTGGFWHAGALNLSKDIFLPLIVHY